MNKKYTFKDIDDIFDFEKYVCKKEDCKYYYPIYIDEYPRKFRISFHCPIIRDLLEYTNEHSGDI